LSLSFFLCYFFFFISTKKEKVTKKKNHSFRCEALLEQTLAKSLLFDEQPPQTNQGFQGATLTYRSVLFSFSCLLFKAKNKP
jgi:hypothetical protein